MTPTQRAFKMIGAQATALACQRRYDEAGYEAAQRVFTRHFNWFWDEGYTADMVAELVKVRSQGADSPNGQN